MNKVKAVEQAETRQVVITAHAGARRSQIPAMEALLVSDVAGPTVAEATRDQAVVRTGEGPAAVFPSRETRPTLLALLLT